MLGICWGREFIPLWNKCEESKKKSKQSKCAKAGSNPRPQDHGGQPMASAT